MKPTNPRVAGVVAQSPSSQAGHGPEPVDLWWPTTEQIVGPQGAIRITFFVRKSTDQTMAASYQFLKEYCEMVLRWRAADGETP